MTELRSKIIKWLHTQPNWMQETANRLLAKGNLVDHDLIELTALLKTEEGQKRSNHRSFSGLTRNRTKDMSLRLVSIGEIIGIDKLSPRNPLVFGNGNLVVIYGHNGSGKSGYARIIKKASGKPRAKKLQSNVFKEVPAEQSCKISYESEGELKTPKWDANGNHIKDLESVDVFDRDEAGFYLTGETNVSYTPPEVLLFEKLAQVCDRVKSVLQDQQDKLVSRKPSIPSKYNGTKVGYKYNSITASTSKEELNGLLLWTEENHKKLEQLYERLKEADPNKLADTKNKKKQTLDRLINSIKYAQSLLDDNAIDRLKFLKKSVAEKRITAIEGAKVKTQTAKLEGLGTETWRALWEAAREYSIKEAYPEKVFPVVGTNARCVLCHQELREDASQRLQDFEEFIKGKLELEAKKAEEELRNALEKLPSAPEIETLELHCQDTGIDEKQKKKIKDYWRTATAKVVELKNASAEGEYKGLNSPKSLLESMELLSGSLQEQINQHKIDAKEFDLQKIEQDVLEMETKKWVSQQKDAIEEEIERLKKIVEFETWKGMTNPRGVSFQAGKISKIAITEDYIKRFNDELKELGAKNILVKLVKTRIDRGRIMHQIKLKDVEQQGSNATAVLSDGERRVVALAAFLADVVGRPEPTPFVFDDPISSLDNEFEWEVAMRLAKLATERQVIVLTHRLSFFGVLEEAEKAVRNEIGSTKKNLEQRCIEKFSGSAGHPADQQAWAQNTKTANNTLIDRLNQAKEFWDSGDSNNYKIHAQAICSDFRKLIERTVEDDLLCEIVKRHRRSVRTQNKLNGLVAVKREDCKFIDDLMTKYSKFEHSQSDEMPVEVPDEPILREDLVTLKTWRTEFKNRKP